MLAPRAKPPPQLVTDKQDQESDWRSEFNRDGELLVYDMLAPGRCSAD
jgi:hypothetical protein